MRVIEDVNQVPFDSLAGRRIFTAGSDFAGLTSRAFRALLRQAGAKTERHATRQTELLVVGQGHTHSAIMAILLGLSHEHRPPAIRLPEFLVAFGHELVDLPVAQTTFGEHLQTLRRRTRQPDA